MLLYVYYITALAHVVFFIMETAGIATKSVKVKSVLITSDTLKGSPVNVNSISICTQHNERLGHLHSFA